MDDGVWLNGVIPGDGSLRPGGYSNDSNHPTYPNYTNNPDYSGSGKTTERGGNTSR